MTKLLTRILLAGCFVSALFFLTTAASQNAYPHFQDVAHQAGLTVSHISGEKNYILESMSGGVGG